MVPSEDLEDLGLYSYLTVPVHHGKLEATLGEITGRLPERETQKNFTTRGLATVEPENLVKNRDDAARHPNPLVLLAEDNPINQKVACLMLAKIGYEVDVVTNGYEVLDAVAQKDYAAILMDVQMPEMDGLEASRQIRSGDSPARDPMIPIIALTAHAMDADRQRSLAAGMDDHASKPINSETIAAILNRHIGDSVRTRPTTEESEKNLEPDHLVPTVRV